jgi:hypothetical protein
MADGVVRVAQQVSGRREITRVSAHAVEEYLETHPGAVVLDSDWREQAVKVQRAESRPAASEKDK